MLQIGGVHTRTLPNLCDGTFSLELLEQCIRGDDVHSPITGLIVAENTHNMCGGKVVPMDWLEKVEHNFLCSFMFFCNFKIFYLLFFF